MANRRANNNVEATRNIETPTTRARESRDSHSGRNIRTSSRDSTAIFSNEAEGSINVHGNAFSTTTGSHGAQQQYITREDQSSSIGSTSSNTQAAQAAHVVETKRRGNAEDLDSQSQASESSTESSQDLCEDASSPPPTKSKTRKRRGRGWSRKKASRSSRSEHSEGRAISSSKKRRIGEADAKDHELRSRKRQRVTEPVGGPSSVIPPISEGPPVARNIRSLRSRNVIIPAANGGTTRGRDTNRTIQTAVPGLVVERPRLDDTQSTEPESTPVKIEEEDETNFLFNAPGPSNHFPEAPVNAPMSESVFQYDSNPGTPGLWLRITSTGEAKAIHQIQHLSQRCKGSPSKDHPQLLL
ncbi:uncharacterized protein FOMMEDRAFT_152513 [Fomitiporia mediterranea MF3/22]|uniref:uncharacterized protein n=1 Tax=Fomitiporia mediterranea (strain MF3/22) TaxID=694068 RepID=UPI000440764A|nr:uncharacterized protein FOMMEDRAFT_152513 [Fomitiporia mediterranea MF3/22]EJD07151.1 hypothetical protein FOMMEDRAFT_152513 [Fomitiporia mediterranea MF3/22]